MGKDGFGMAVKGNGSGGTALYLGQRNRLGQKGLMPPMNPIKESQGIDVSCHS